MPDVDVPERMLALPRDDQSRPIPWFTATIDGQPDFRFVHSNKAYDATTRGICWICGQPYEPVLAFVTDAATTISWMAGEPPCHLACAVYAAKVCPYMVQPGRRRRHGGAPSDVPEIENRAPEVTLIWLTHGYERANRGFRVGDPIGWQWYCRGREATEAEVVDATLAVMRAATQKT